LAHRKRAPKRRSRREDLSARASSEETTLAGLWAGTTMTPLDSKCPPVKRIPLIHGTGTSVQSGSPIALILRLCRALRHDVGRVTRSGPPLWSRRSSSCRECLSPSRPLDCPTNRANSTSSSFGVGGSGLFSTSLIYLSIRYGAPRWACRLIL